jgi:hypothetical protein
MHKDLIFRAGWVLVCVPCFAYLAHTYCVVR